MLRRQVLCCYDRRILSYFFFFFQAEDGIRDKLVTGVQTCALPIWAWANQRPWPRPPRSRPGVEQITGDQAFMRAPTDVRTPLSSLYRRIRSPSPHDQARQSTRDLTDVDETGVRHVNFNQGEVGQPHRDKGPKAIAPTALLFGDDPCHNRPPFVI